MYNNSILIKILDFCDYLEKKFNGTAVHAKISIMCTGGRRKFLNQFNFIFHKNN